MHWTQVQKPHRTVTQLAFNSWIVIGVLSLILPNGMAQTRLGMEVGNVLTIHETMPGWTNDVYYTDRLGPGTLWQWLTNLVVADPGGVRFTDPTAALNVPARFYRTLARLVAVNAVIGPEGGIITAAGLSVEYPAGAFAAPTPVALSIAPERSFGAETLSGPFTLAGSPDDPSSVLTFRYPVGTVPTGRVFLVLANPPGITAASGGFMDQQPAHHVFLRYGGLLRRRPDVGAGPLRHPARTGLHLRSLLYPRCARAQGCPTLPQGPNQLSRKHPVGRRV